MERNKFDGEKAAELRKKAEKIMRQKDSQKPNSLDDMTAKEIKEVLHELEVHQVELELQNEELRETQTQLEKARSRYYELFDLAPVGYCTLSKEDIIEEANLAAASYLEESREELIQKQISQYILSEDQDIYYHFRKSLFETGNSQECELRMQKAEGEIFWVKLKAELINGKKDRSSVFLTIEDITEKVKEEIKRKERAKELKGLYFTSKLVQSRDKTIDEILFRLSHKISDFFQYPEKTCARINFAGEEYLSENFQENGCQLKSDIIVEGVKKGAIEVFALDKKREASENFFLKEERSLIWGISRTLGNEFSRRESYASLEMSQKVFDIIDELVFYLDEDFNIEWTNQAAYDYFSDKSEDLIEEKCYKKWDFSNICQGCPIIRAKMSKNTEQTEMVKRDGSTWLMKAFPDLDTEGNIKGIVEIAQDITKRKKVEKELKKEKEKLSKILNNTNDIIWSLSLSNSEIEFINSKVEDVTGYSPEEFKQKPELAKKILHPDDEHLYDKILKNWQEKGQGSIEIRIITKDGSIKWIQNDGQLIYDENGKPVKIIVVGRDITERKEMEEELRNNKNLLQSLVNKVPGTVYQVQLLPDGSYSFLYATDGIYDIYEVTPEEAKKEGDKLFDRHHPEDYERVVATIKKSAENLTVWEEEFRVELPEKGLRWLEGYAEPEQRPDGSVLWHGNIRDITERKEREKKLQKQKEEIEKLNNRLNENIEKGKMMHRQFLPDQLPEVNSLTFGTYYEPADRLGGDFYDLIEFEDELLFYISDVSGHDLSSSMLNIFLKETINSYLFHCQQMNKKNKLSPASIIQHVNDRFREESFPANYFISLMIGIIDKRNFELNLSNAGFQFLPFIIQRDGNISYISCSDMPVSMISENIVWKDCNYILQPGDTFIMNTDGLFEQIDSKGNMYGKERLMKILTQNTDLKPEKMVNKIYQDFREFKGEMTIQDDLTSLLIQREFD